MGYLGAADLPDDQVFIHDNDMAAAKARVDARRANLPSDGKNWAKKLRVGGEVYVSSRKSVTRLKEGQTISIEPGEFALMNTQEILTIPPDVVGFISMRTKFKLRGLVNISGFHVDPNYWGRLIFAVYNAGPNAFMVRRGEPMFMIVFSRVPAQWMGSSIDPIDNIPVELADAVRGEPVSLAKLFQRVRQLESRTSLVLSVAGAVIGGVALGLLVFIIRAALS